MTYSELKSKLSSILSQRTKRRYNDTDRDSSLNNAYRKICTKVKIGELAKTGTVNFTANSNEFNLPTDFMKFDLSEQSLYVDAKKYENKLEYITPEERQYIDLTKSSPAWGWYRQGRKGYLNAPAEKTYTGVLEYYGTPVSLSEDDIEIDTAFASCIAWWAAMDLLSPTNPNRPAVESEAINQLNELIYFYEVQGEDNQQEYIQL